MSTLATILQLAQVDAAGQKAGRAIALGIGYIFGKVIESVTRQPEMREEITSIQWLGFALTEAVVFYGLLGSILAYVLV